MEVKAATGITIDGGLKISIKAGAGWITIGPEGVSMGGPIVKINSGGSGTSAKAAKKAIPTAPKKPAEIKEKKDPLAK
jgi:type VI secretion system secreted protein VgrG